MKVYVNEEKKDCWYSKVEWLRVTFSFFLILVLFFLFFYFLIGDSTNLARALVSSAIISFLISLGMVIHYVIDDKINVYVVKKDKLYVIFPHMFSSEYDDFLISFKDFRNFISKKENITKLLNNPDSVFGVDVFEVGKINSCKFRKNSFIFRAVGMYTEWRPVGGVFTISDYKVKRHNTNKKFTVLSQYNDFNELVHFIEENLKGNNE